MCLMIMTCEETATNKTLSQHWWSQNYYLNARQKFNYLLKTCSWAKHFALLFRTQSEVFENVHCTGQGGEVITSLTRQKWWVQQPPHVISFYLGSQHATLYQHPHKQRQEIICPQCYTPLVWRFHLFKETNNETMRGRKLDYPYHT